MDQSREIKFRKLVTFWSVATQPPVPAAELDLIGGAEGDRTPDLRIANGLGPPLHGLSRSDIQ